MQGYQLYLLGKAAFEEEKFDDARRLLEESLTVERHFRTHFMLAGTLTRLGRHVQAFSHAEQAYSLSPVNDAVSVDFAERLAARGEHARALVIVRETLARNERCGPAQVLLMTIPET